MDQRRALGALRRPSLLAALSALDWTSPSTALAFFALGLALLLLFQWRQWRRDLARLAQLAEPAPLPPLDSWERLPAVSVLVAAWNEAPRLPRVIESFTALRYPYKQLVLVAGGADGSFALAQKLASPDILVLEQNPGEGKQRALQKGLALCSGEILYLTDADCIFEDEPFERTLLPLLAGEMIATGSRRPLAEQSRHPFVVYQGLLHEYGAWRHPPYLQGIEGRNCAVTHQTLARLGEFRTPAPIGTDAALAARAVERGVKIRYLPASRMQTEYPQRLGAYLRQQSRWQRNQLLHGSPCQRRSVAGVYLARSCLGLAVLLGVFSLFCPFRLVPAVWGLLALYGLASRLRYLSIARRTLPTGLAARSLNLFQVAGFMAVEYLAWLRVWWDYLRLSTRWGW